MRVAALGFQAPQFAHNAGSDAVHTGSNSDLHDDVQAAPGRGTGGLEIEDFVNKMDGGRVNQTPEYRFRRLNEILDIIADRREELTGLIGESG